MADREKIFIYYVDKEMVYRNTKNSYQSLRKGQLNSKKKKKGQTKQMEK